MRGMGGTMGLELIVFFMLVFMAGLGYGGAYLHMSRQIKMREIEINILHMYISKELDNEERRTVGI
jgi:hypothetical protein|tara:strand:+ start:5391 stop:5588 length:198 start_codon:yes stop_codon:yes gene_type:complete